MNRQREASIHSAVAGFLRAQYPGIIFRTDFAAGIKMTMGQAVRHKQMQSGRAYPDLFIAQPVGKYHGMFVELKAEGTPVYLKNGQITKNPHIREQLAMLEELDSLGYRAIIAVGFEQAIKQIKQYLGGTNDHENDNQPF